MPKVDTVMASLAPVTIELPSALLDNLEAYVRAIDAFMSVPEDAPADIMEAAELNAHSASLVAITQLLAQLEGRVAGSLKEALATLEHNAKLRMSVQNTSGDRV